MKRKIAKAVNLICFFIFNRAASVFTKVNKNKALFLSESHRNLDGNLKCVYDKLPEGIEKAVHVKGDRRNKSGISDTISVWLDMTTSAYIFLDDFYGLTSAMKVREGQQIIQLWHGAGAYKKFGFSRINTGDKIERVHGGYRKYTMAVTSSDDIRGCYAEAFGIDVSKTAATGIPRTDMFFDEELKECIRTKFFNEHPYLNGKKLILIAPTYRGRKVEDADYDFDYADPDRLVEELGEEYAVLTKWHPALRNNIEKGRTGEKRCNHVYAFSDYKDINELLVVCDVLITDYSSVIFDYSLLNKPIVYFVYDKEDYADNRGLYYDFDEYIYGTVVEKREELADAVRKEDMCSNLREEFNRKFMSACTGNSTEKVIKEAEVFYAE